MKETFQAVRGVLFDYGGTLDTNGIHWAHILWAGFQAAQIPVSEQVFREAYVYGERTLGSQPIIQPTDNFLSLLRKKTDAETRFLTGNGKWHTSEAERTKKSLLVAAYGYDYVRQIIQRITIPVLTALSERFPLVLVSNFYGNLPAVLADFGLTKFFLNVIESATVGVRKPSPAMFQLGIEHLHLLPDQVVVVGDSFDKDIVPAHEAGCRSIWLRGKAWEDLSPEHTKHPLITKNDYPTTVITDLEDLLPLLS